ncbi:MAG TPA: VWA domain-containing protein [Actinomycetota bacterium]|nr:VWA domain-containing protein [Actinomycetota bacterium]
MRFSDPWWLVALAIGPVLWWMHRRGASAVPARQNRVGLVVRMVILACVVLALAGATLHLPERRVATVFVVDVSDSVGGVAGQEAFGFVTTAIEGKPADAMAGVVAFGREARVELSLSEQAQLVQIASRPDGTRTNLARALRLAAALLPEGARRRIVVLSDGRENSGDARAEAARLRRLGIRVDAVALSGRPGDGAAVTGVRAPSRVRTGEEFDVEVTLSAGAPMAARLVTSRGAEVIDERDVQLVAGDNTVKLTQTAGEPGALNYRVELRAERDSVPQNDSGAAMVLVAGPPRVMVLEQAPEEGRLVAQALAERGLSVERRGVNGFPSADELAATDALVLVDVEATQLTDAQVGSLQGFVRQLGRGLVTVGGENSWSLGGYRNSRLEELLPLESDIKDPRRRPSIAQVLAIDTSGSMSTCHCAGPNVRSDRLAQGPNKTDISRTASARAIEALSENDEVGVLAFNTSSQWVLPLQKLPSAEVVRNGLSRLHPTGGTAIPQAIQTAVADLKASKASLKHIILFTDGWSQTTDLSDVARWVKEQGITLSVVATGEGTGTELARMAEEGGGRFYAGTNLYRIPEIFMSEVTTATRRYINEGEFFPKITGSSPAVTGLTSSPPLLGYVGTTAKPSASVEMATGEFDDPLLATWRTGLGVVTSWTSDAKGRWATHWLGWNGFADFWSNVVRQTLPAAPVPGFSSQATPTEDGLEVVVESEQPLPEGTTGKARVVAPNGEPLDLELSRSGPDRLSGTLQASAPGSYLISTDLTAGGGSLYRDTVGAVRSYSGEYAPGAPDTGLLRDVVAGTRGRWNPLAEQVFDPNLPAGSRRVEIWSWLALIAALLLPLDVALRRVIVTRDDLAAARALRPPWMQKAAARSDRMERLLQAKYRVRQAETPPRRTPPSGPSPPADPQAEPAAKAKPQREPRPSGEAEKKEAAPPGSAPPAAGGLSELVRRKRERSKGAN